MTQTPDDTRQRLIEAAGEIFGEEGFRAATVREICARARANLAAVNYHFGDKFALYVAAVQAAHCGNAEMLNPQWPADMDAPTKLRVFIREWLRNFLDESRPAWQAKLMLREMAEPTEACAKLVEAYIRPMAQSLHDILIDLLPANVREDDRWLIGFSIVGQCLFYKVHRPVAELLFGKERYGELDLDRLSEHISRFSLAALGQGPAISQAMRASEATS
ncbi:MAG: CerR family C-terminal domain-containing protein [Planctomycetaceae bacterium]